MMVVLILLWSCMFVGVTSFVQPQFILHRPASPSYPPCAAVTEISDITETDLTAEGIAELIEVSFLQSCLQLNQGYIDVLKLFIVAVKVGYERSIPLSELNQLVVDCPVNSAGRDLMAEEKALRVEWMKVVYELLNALNSNSIDSSCILIDDNEDINKRVSQVVKSIVTIQSDLRTEETNSGGEKDAKVALNNLSVEQAIEASGILLELKESTLSDPMGAAFLTNDVRVALTTFQVLQEEELCMEGSSGNTSSKDVPRPPIPGTG